MSKLVIFEAADGLGKTTQCAMAVKALQASLLSQPNKHNVVGWIRGEAKNNPNLTPFERQLLIAVSHTVDAYDTLRKELGQGFSVVMDRSWLSGMVYGRLQGVDSYQEASLVNILGSVYKDAISKYSEACISTNPVVHTGKVEVHIVFLTRSERYDKPDNDVFEQQIKWEDLNRAYVEVYDKLVDGQFKVFSDTERYHLIDVGNMTAEEVHTEVMKRVS